MAVSNFNLPFNQQNIQQMPIRNRPDRYAQTALAERFRFEVSEGIRPAEYFGVYKYLPVLQKDITTEDYIVIPKGRIVSSLSTENLTPVGGIKNPASSGTLYSFESNTTGSIVTRGIDTSYFGYDDYMSNLIIPANGGTQMTQYYSSNDVDAGTLDASGAYAAAGENFVSPVNYPVGVTFHDWYQDIRGKYLNYRMWPDGGHVLCDWYVEVPFVKTTAGANTVPLGSGVTPVPTVNSMVDMAAKYDINKKFTYLAIEVDSDTFTPGVWINSDILGNYNIEGVGSRSVQTVGRLIGIDNRFPKAGMDDVQTYPGSDMPGTQTAGLPSFLFEFVKACQNLTGSAATVEDILNYVQAGYYGVARIQLSVA